MTKASMTCSNPPVDGAQAADREGRLSNARADREGRLSNVAGVEEDNLHLLV